MRQDQGCNNISELLPIIYWLYCLFFGHSVMTCLHKQEWQGTPKRTWNPSLGSFRMGSELCCLGVWTPCAHSKDGTVLCYHGGATKKNQKKPQPKQRKEDQIMMILCRLNSDSIHANKWTYQHEWHFELCGIFLLRHAGDLTGLFARLWPQKTLKRNGSTVGVSPLSRSYCTMQCFRSHFC